MKRLRPGNYSQEVSRASQHRIWLKHQLLTGSINNVFIPPVGDFSGPISLGHLMPTGAHFGLHPNELAHTLIVGQTRAGKTNTIYHIASSIIEQSLDIRCVFFDPKDDYKFLAKEYPGQIIVLDMSTLQINDFEVFDWMDPKQWMALITDIHRQAYYLRDGSGNLLMDLLDELNKEKGVYEGSRNYVTSQDIVKKLENRKFRGRSRSEGYAESLLNRNKGRIISLGQVFDCVQGLPLTEIFKESHVVIRMSGMSDDDSAFLCMYILSCVYYERMARNHRGNNIDTIIVVDEAHLPMNQARDRPELGTPILPSHVRTLPEFKVAILAATQEPRTLIPSLLSNCFTQVLFPISHGLEINYIKQAMSLTNEQLSVLPSLEKGQAIIRSGKLDRAALIQVPLMEVDKTLSDEELAQYAKPLRYSARRVASVVEVNAQVKEDQEVERDLGHYRRALKQLLEAVAGNPYEKFSSICRQADFALATGIRVKDQAVKKGLVVEEQIRLRSRGKAPLFLEITPKGYEFLDELAVSYEKPKGKGLFEHRLYQDRVAKSFEKEGNVVQVEDCEHGYDFWKLVDVAVTTPKGMRLAVEVELSPKHVLENIQRDFQVGFERVVIVTKKDLVDRIKRMVERNLDSCVRDKVEVRQITEFVE